MLQPEHVGPPVFDDDRGTRNLGELAEHDQQAAVDQPRREIGEGLAFDGADHLAVDSTA